MFDTKNETQINSDLGTENQQSHLTPHERELMRHAQEMKRLLTKLELPWDIYIPMFYKAFVIYHERMDIGEAHNKSLNITYELIKNMVYLSRSTQFIHKMSDHYHNQIQTLQGTAQQRKNNQ